MQSKKRNRIIIFTIVCIMLISGMILYERFSIFKENQNIIKEDIESISGTEFAFFVDNKPVNTIPKKSIKYSLNTYESKCYDSISGEQISNVSWDNEKWKVILKGITNTKSKCELHFDKIYIDKTLNTEDGSIGPIPDLGNGRLVPIKIDSSTGTPVVKKADIFKEWYNYGSQQWANAVILKDGKEDTYEPDDEINEDDIESYFVWIPRYRYMLQENEDTFNSYQTAKDLGSYSNISDVYEAMKATNTDGNKATNHGFDIVFESKDQEVSYTTQKGQYLTHPAFTSFNSNGFWVGKFETSKSGSVEDNSISPESVQIKPNVTSWRNINVSNAFYTTYNYQRELDSHMMKNTEWGAVAYLTNSIYGRCSENKCEEVRINNNSNITGSSAVSVPTCGPTETSTECNRYGTDSAFVIYSNPASVVSSTTNNYYGVFDMAGGASEYVMGVLADSNGKPASGFDSIYNSNFVGTLTCPTCMLNSDRDKKEWTVSDGGKPWPDSKYYDTYEYANNEQQFQRGLLGDGTKEFGPFYKVAYKTGTSPRRVSGWNADAANFVGYGAVWFVRGGHSTSGTEAGVGAFSNAYGSGNGSFRVVLTP